MQNKLKKVLQHFSIIALIDLLYLNVLVPVTLSFEQLFLIALEVVNVCNEKGRDVSTLSPDELDQLIELAIVAVKQVFKENGFRFLPIQRISKTALGLTVLVNFRQLLSKTLCSLTKFITFTNSYFLRDI